MATGLPRVYDFAAGSISGGVAVVVGHPFDTVRVRLQAITGQSTVFDSMRNLVRADGVVGFYRGLSPQLMIIPFQLGVTFWSYGMTKKYLERRAEVDERFKSDATVSALSGAAAGFAQTLVANPFEVAKVRMQVSLGSTNGVLPYMWRIAQVEGLRSLASGLVANTIRRVPANAIFFGSYASLKPSMKEKAGMTGIALAGAAAGILSWVFTYPMDVLKTRIQVQERPMGTVQLLRGTLKSEGPSFLFRGLGMTLLRCLPTYAVLFVTYEAVLNVLKDGMYVPLRGEDVMRKRLMEVPEQH
mmetsp:Transcript_23739/g.93493  ORF Transcript_23739/g.93493 Transcript_23739/m.93493 type:complete len:300 (-) Transcript_23739:120-1019(-)|eukprot:CAMPEP_0113956910 /NCGR_PEP_ID=MMETSP0011_2-20120614/2378_1 /TAXON_ID=101924 /ORGANISM="Rhodosorus marinus" /LENGTH=299 /DNA_ID=CAMNT_0000967217 /DNA_START=49 /DNA_END=948 /DNA_ORIENTATION=- /assembly_acc=CAM_ASM_000156